jgi:hypothetical protein
MINERTGGSEDGGSDCRGISEEKAKALVWLMGMLGELSTLGLMAGANQLTVEGLAYFRQLQMEGFRLSSEDALPHLRELIPASPETAEQAFQLIDDLIDNREDMLAWCRENIKGPEGLS